MLELEAINDDILIYIFLFLEPPEILSLRKTCRRTFNISRLRIIWMNVCIRQILEKGYPFPPLSLDALTTSELERRTCHAFRLASQWLSNGFIPSKTVCVGAAPGISISDVRFVPGHDGQWLLTVSKGVWDVITIWDVSTEPPRCVEWSVRGVMITGFVLNTNPSSIATLAVSVLRDSERTIEILALNNDTASFRTILSIASHMRPITLQDDLLAMSDDATQTVIRNWRADTSAILQHFQGQWGTWQHNKCIQVVFAYKSVLVVRAHSIHLFLEPVLKPTDLQSPAIHEPTAQHSFGWIDGVSITRSVRLGNGPFPFEPLSILVRRESDDPWSSRVHNLELYTLQPNPHFEAAPNAIHAVVGLSPYIFPPALSTRVHVTCGALRCTDVILGKYGTALWIQPQDRAITGLLWPEGDYPLPATTSDGLETLVAAVFPGPLATDSDCNVTHSRTLFANHHDNWTSLDYDEELGRIVLASGYGRLMILEL